MSRPRKRVRVEARDAEIAAIRGVLVDELRAYLAAFAPELESPAPDAIKAHVERRLAIDALPPEAEQAALDRLAIVRDTCLDAWLLIARARKAAGLAAPPDFGDNDDEPIESADDAAGLLDELEQIAAGKTPAKIEASDRTAPELSEEIVRWAQQYSDSDSNAPNGARETD